MHEVVPAVTTSAADRYPVTHHSVLRLVVLFLGCGELGRLPGQVPFLQRGALSAGQAVDVCDLDHRWATVGSQCAVV